MGNEDENRISRFGIFAVKADHIDDKPLGGSFAQVDKQY